MNVSSVVNHFSTANKGFITTLGSTISAGATTIPLTSVSGLTNGSIFVGIIEPGLANEQEFTGTVDTAGVQLTGVKWTDGTNVDHTAGVTIVDYVAATDWNMITKGILVHADQDGTLKAGAVDVTAVIADGVITRPKLATSFGSEFTTGWNTADLPAVSTVTANGNRSYDITFASTVASILSSGMQLRTTRTVAAPTYMGGLMNGSSHYFTKATPTSTLSTVTNNFTLHATVQPTSYASAGILGRSDATPNNALNLIMESDGRITVIIRNAATANFRYVSTYQSVPLNKKTTITASWTSGTCVIYFDGVSVPVAAAVAGGTAPTTAGTGGDFSVGRTGAYAALYFPGYISGVGVFDAVLSASTIKAMQGQALTGSETNCIGAWSLNNTAVNQQAPGTNDLTATGGVGYSNKSPYGNDGVSSTLDYSLVMSVSGSTATVQVPEGCTIPTSGGVTSAAYSVQGNPYGWVSDKGRWAITSFMQSAVSAAGTANTYQNLGSFQLNVPVGSWNLLYGNFAQVTHAGATSLYVYNNLSTSPTSASDPRFLSRTSEISSSTAQQEGFLTRNNDVSLTAATPYYLITAPGTSSSTVYSGTGGAEITARPTGL